MQETAKQTLTIENIYSIYKKYSIIGKDYFLPVDISRSHTKQEILLVATILFSQKGYHGVSIHDISKIIGIKTSSVYNHFQNKEEIWEKVLLHSTKLFLLYMREVSKYLARKNKIKDMLDIVFYEPKRMENIFPCYAFGVIQRERIYNTFAGKLFSKICKHTVKILTRNFKQCSDINEDVNLDSVGMTILLTIFFGLNCKAEDLLTNTTSYDFAEFFDGIQKMLLSSIQA
ncbi:MAG: TetR/AcrR family transcriptional regulator [Desulfovibrio sp.]|jgi:AcrR family transcriptional regulator|nr:TetR/AcrR family transcriptional regulator [Desulfovibrio sp.]